MPADAKTPVALAGTTKSVKVTVAPAAPYTLVSPKAALVTTQWVFNVKAAKNQITAPVPANVLRVVDNPGIKDWAEVTGVEGVVYTVGAKALNVRPGKVAKVARAKDSANLAVTATPATGYQFGDGSTTSVSLSATFTDTTVSTAEPVNITGRSVTVAPDAAVKTWQFTGSDGKVLKIAIPKGVASVAVVVPGAGKVKAVPVAGYSFSKGEGTNKDEWTVS